jgi:hypothetical protein
VKARGRRCQWLVVVKASAGAGANWKEKRSERSEVDEMCTTPTFRANGNTDGGRKG